MPQYDYTKSAPVDLEALEYEIRYDGSITKSIEGMSFDSAGDSLSISFSEALTGGEETTVTNIVSSHTGSALSKFDMWCKNCVA